MREKSWRKGLKIGAVAVILLLLVGTIFAGSTMAKKDTGRPPEISEQEEKEIIKNLEKIKEDIPTSIRSGLGIAADWGCDYWPSARVVCNSYPVYFEMSNSASKVYFKGIYVSVWSGSRINQGTLLGEHTYATYKSPSTILSEMRQLHPGYNPSVHIKYFVQGQTRYWALVSSQGWSGVGYDRYIELWSEANYNYVGGWETWGYPYDPDGGAGKIRTTGQVYTSTGNAYHLAYPWYHERKFGNPEILLKSNFLHQFAIQRVS